ncbi:NERD domain-containing protein [Neobacillus cucumis]|uniref:NERD domain-containing protein n=1 Tax=Neobacillus cucumis TaxID=1740721 RepID=UPI00204004AB|nr:NERD domain-containing protein [Neobacillus cucumis]MCM3729799.1 NERD domain-containing protein [Neobacillus cucumis]
MFFIPFLIVLGLIILSRSPTLKGKIGENKVKKTLEQLDPSLYTSFHDLYIPIKNGSKTSQVDHVVLSPKGLFVIETKNYKGWITGSEQSQQWNQTNYSRKDKFRNPILQNYGHIMALKEYLGELVDKVPFYSIIVFGDQAELKFNTDFKNAFVIKRNSLLDVIKGHGEPISLNHNELNKLKQRIHKLSTRTHEEKRNLAKKHKTEIRSNLTQQKKSINENICPKCGNKLVVRKGKYGSFKGCSSFPKCKFTA